MSEHRGESSHVSVDDVDDDREEVVMLGTKLVEEDDELEVVVEVESDGQRPHIGLQNFCVKVCEHKPGPKIGHSTSS